MQKCLQIIFCFLCFVWPIRAEQLPVRIYATADGLPRDRIWFCTNDGLSRFDGYEFGSTYSMTVSIK